MTSEQLRTTIKTLVDDRRTCTDLYRALQDFAQRGGSQQQALEVLMGLRAEYDDEDRQDLLADVLDYVGGWCLPEHRIWPAPERD